MVPTRIDKAPGKDQRKQYQQPGQRAKSRRNRVDDECDSKDDGTAGIPISEPIDLGVLQGVAEQQQ